MTPTPTSGKNGDVIRFHWRSGLIGGAIALLLGGGIITVVSTVFPNSEWVRGVAKAFAGGVCDDIHNRLHESEKSLQCCEVLLTVNDIQKVGCDTNDEETKP